MTFKEFLKLTIIPSKVQLDALPAVMYLDGSPWNQFPPAQKMGLMGTDIQAWLSDNCTDEYYSRFLLGLAWPNVEFEIED